MDLDAQRAVGRAAVNRELVITVERVEREAFDARDGHVDMVAVDAREIHSSRGGDVYKIVADGALIDESIGGGASAIDSNRRGGQAQGLVFQAQQVVHPQRARIA